MEKQLTTEQGDNDDDFDIDDDECSGEYDYYYCYCCFKTLGYDPGGWGCPRCGAIMSGEYY